MYKSNILLSLNWKNLVYLLYTQGWVGRDVKQIEIQQNSTETKKSGNMCIALNQRLISNSMTINTISILFYQFKQITKQNTHSTELSFQITTS